ncbi:MAG: NlpC/P60 family protein [Clostridiales bacterium]|nr:NlpC/P60 family protein [Clostridiales bacterium]
MVQKFVKELNDSAKQSDRSGSAETTATEQVETTAREIVHEAVQLPHRAIQYPARKESADSSANAQPEQSTQPHHAPESPRERTDAPRTRSDATPPQSTSIPAPQEQARRAYVQQTAKTATPAQPITSEQPQHTTVTVPSAENAPRQRTVDIRTLSEPKRPQRAPATTPQEQTRRACVQQTAKTVTTAPSITPEQSQPQAPTVTAPLMENTPRQRTDDVRTRPEAKQPRSAPTLTPQEQGRRAYVRQAKKSRAEKPSARDHLHTEQPEIRNQVQSEAAPAKPSAVRHVKQSGAWTPRKKAAATMRGKGKPIRERSAVTPAQDLPPTPQAQARQAFAEKQAQLSQNPSIESIYPSEPATPVPPQPPVSDAPAITLERQPVTTGNSKSAPPVQPSAPAQTSPTEKPPAIREKPKPNAAPREKSRRGVDIRTRDTEQISAPTAQPKTPVSKIDTKRARKAATQDAQRKMLKKGNNRAARAAAAAAKKLAEAAAKAVKELISALASLGGGTALFIVFSIVIVAGAFLASPLGILFADEQQADDTVPLATAIAEIQGEYHVELERLQNGDFASVQIVGQAPDWREVVAVFASKTAGAEDGVDVFTLDEGRVELLRQVFWDMCEITTATQTVDVPDSNPDDDVDDSHTGIALTITITAKTAEQMRLIYAFTKYQNDALDILLENLGSLNIPMGSLTISQEDAIELLENLPDDLDPARKAVVETAVQLVGRVSYFWGGKSLTLGWDDRWGVPTEVTAAGSGSTGTVRPFGLDCSGFVDWTFYNATNGSYYPGRGGGAATQHSYCTNISWSDAQPGDLVFYPDDSHVGIVGGKDADGNLLIVHCSGGANGVVITGSAGFTTVARPDCFTE